MGEYISFGYFNKTYFLYVFLNFLLNVGKNLNLKLFTHFSDEIKSFIEDQPNIFIKVLNNSIGLSLCIVPELLINYDVSKKNEENEINKKYYCKKKVHTIINALTILIYFSLDKYMIKRPRNLYYNSIIFIIFLFIISIFIFKNKYYNHQYFSIVGIIILLIISYIFQNIFAKSFSIEVLFVNILIGIIKSISFGYSQLFMTKYYYSPLKICYEFGMINSIISLILYFIISHIPCEYDCNIKYKNKFYFDNIYSYFNNLTIIKAVYVLIFHLLEVNKLLIFNIIIEKYSLCHLIMPDLIISFFHIIESYYEDIRKKDAIVKVIICILTFFFFVFEVFMSLVFIEIIELKLFGLNKNIKKNIEQRAIRDIEATKNVEEKTIKEDILELNGYLVNFDNNEYLYDDEGK